MTVRQYVRAQALTFASRRRRWTTWMISDYTFTLMIFGATLGILYDGTGGESPHRHERAIESLTDRNSEVTIAAPEIELQRIRTSENNVDGVLSALDAWGSEVQYGLNEDECCICLCAFRSGEKVFQLLCNHQYHRVCIENWRRIDPRCPLCKHILKIQAL
ncbi:hypothetical protein O6H91_07G044700 [Diphasiastrum complanatum]|uniref:Uncharacterized protein n=1 Tax=Diphasiastrum complanatum TaxID=34168 RepID=A0ACC2D4P6_DIPCM|nr:hypothetical protein O6H91_07G044700 [Diphasiastrum complanatum]